MIKQRILKSHLPKVPQYPRYQNVLKCKPSSCMLFLQSRILFLSIDACTKGETQTLLSRSRAHRHHTYQSQHRLLRLQILSGIFRRIHTHPRCLSPLLFPAANVIRRLCDMMIRLTAFGGLFQWMTGWKTKFVHPRIPPVNQNGYELCHVQQANHLQIGFYFQRPCGIALRIEVLLCLRVVSQLASHLSRYIPQENLS